MKIAIYSPYLDSFGGGERYILTIAESLSKNASVDLLFDANLFSIDAKDLKNKLSERFDLNLSKVETVPAPIGKGSNFLQRAFFLAKYDVLFYLTDGSIFYPTAKKNILHIQSPIKGQSAKNVLGKLKLSGWDVVIYNSNFTKVNCEKFWPIKSKVVYPPVDIKKIKSIKKKKYILSVGRFFGFLKDKKHELLINTFKDLYKDKSLQEWSLHLAGSTSKGDLNYLDELKNISKGFPITFYPNLEYDKLIRLYGESSIYWHASGYGEDDPTKMEHFGISTVEAMKGGCVPVVIGKGGQLEIVEDKISGYFWQTPEELVKITAKLMQDSKLIEQISRSAIKRSENFSKEHFNKEILNLL